MPFLPARVERLLDAGCGSGATTLAIRERFPGAWAAGIEMDQAAILKARAVFDRLFEGRFDDQPLEAAIAPGSLDVILCLDVLEHFAEPWAAAARLAPLLRPGGRLIISVPNVRNLRFLMRLLFRGDFRYRDSGILDRTHLRFFTRETAIELTAQAGLVLIHAQSVQAWPAVTLRGLMNRLTAARSDELFAKQWLIVAEQTV